MFENTATSLATGKGCGDEQSGLQDSHGVWFQIGCFAEFPMSISFTDDFKLPFSISECCVFLCVCGGPIVESNVGAITNDSR